MVIDSLYITLQWNYIHNRHIAFINKVSWERELSMLTHRPRACCTRILVWQGGYHATRLHLNRIRSPNIASTHICTYIHAYYTEKCIMNDGACIRRIRVRRIKSSNQTDKNSRSYFEIILDTHNTILSN